MRVIVVDDSAFMRRALRRVLQRAPGIEVIETGRNGREGLELARRLRPDVITLDIEMPEMDGLTALRRIMAVAPTRVLMLSSLTTEGSKSALQALKLGAADVLAKDGAQDVFSLDHLERELVAKVRALGQARPADPRTPEAPADRPPAFRPRQFDAICIGSSTGGPPVLETILAQLPPALRPPIVIAQHMPAVFTASMAKRLDELCPLPVVHAEHNMPLAPGQVYVAPGGRHLHLRRLGPSRRQLSVEDEPRDALYRPSVDVLFSSAAETTGRRTLAIQLTGMGCDGLEGARRLHQRGATVLAQSEASCVVYGMPKGVTEEKIAAASLSPSGIVQALASIGAHTDAAAAAR